MEKHTLLTKDDDEFRRLGIKPVISETENGKKHVKFTYSQTRKEKAFKEKEHLQLMRYPNDPGTPLHHYYQQLILTGWTDKRGNYHAPYILYIGALGLLAIIGYLISGLIKSALELIITVSVFTLAFGIGWVLHWWNERRERLSVQELALEGIEDPVIVDPDSEDIDDRYITYRTENTMLGQGLFPRDFLFEHILQIGVIELKDKRGRPAYLWNSHIFNLALGPGIKGKKFSNAVLVQGFPTTTIVPKSKEEAYTRMEKTIRGKKYPPEQIQEARNMIEDIYSTLEVLMSKKEQFDALMGKEIFQIDVKNDMMYAYIGSLDVQTETAIRKYKDYMEKGGSLDPEVIQLINEAKKTLEFKSDLPQIQQKFKDSVERKRIGLERGMMPSATDLLAEKRIAIDRNYISHVNTGKKALEQKESKSIDAMFNDFLDIEEDK